MKEAEEVSIHAITSFFGRGWDAKGGSVEEGMTWRRLRRQIKDFCVCPKMALNRLLMTNPSVRYLTEEP